MDVHHDGAALKVLHGIAEDVSARSLHYIFREFRAVAFNSFPFLGAADTFVGDAFSSESVLTDTRLYIGKTPAGRES